MGARWVSITKSLISIAEVVHISRRGPAVYKQEVTVEQILKRVAIVRDVLIDCDCYRGNAEALEDLIEEAQEALTKILNGKEPYQMTTL